MSQALASKNKLLQNKTFKASIIVTISGGLYGFMGFVGTKILQQDISITNMLFWRFCIAGAFMLLFSLRKWIKSNFFSRVNKRDFILMLLVGAIGYTGACGFYFTASLSTGTGLAMVIFFSYPIIVALYAWIRHKTPITLWTIISLIAIAIGLSLLKDSSQHSISFMGIFLALLAAATYAFYVIGSKSFSQLNIDSGVLTTVICFSSSVVFFIMSSFNQSFFIPTELRTWIYMLIFGVVTTAIPIQLMLEGLKYISTLRASIISVLEPLVTVAVGMAFLNESISATQMLGVIIVLGSALLIQFQRGL